MILLVNTYKGFEMFLLILDVKLLRCLADFIALYSDGTPRLEEIKRYIVMKFEEKGIVESYNNGLITQDEVCSFLSGHLYTGFVLNKRHIREVSNDKVEEFHRDVKTLLFKPS